MFFPPNLNAKTSISHTNQLFSVRIKSTGLLPPYGNQEISCLNSKFTPFFENHVKSKKKLFLEEEQD